MPRPSVWVRGALTRLGECRVLFFPLLTVCLFPSLSLREKLRSIAQATYAHSRNLAYFVFTYKGLLAAQSRLQGKRIPFHSFLAACIGGWLVFGDNNPINSQVKVSESFFGQEKQQECQEVIGGSCFWWC